MGSKPRPGLSSQGTPYLLSASFWGCFSSFFARGLIWIQWHFLGLLSLESGVLRRFLGPCSISFFLRYFVVRTPFSLQGFFLVFLFSLFFWCSWCSFSQDLPRSLHAIVSPVEWNSLKGRHLRWFTVRKTTRFIKKLYLKWAFYSLKPVLNWANVSSRS